MFSTNKLKVVLTESCGSEGAWHASMGTWTPERESGRGGVGTGKPMAPLSDLTRGC